MEIDPSGPQVNKKLLTLALVASCGLLKNTARMGVVNREGVHSPPPAVFHLSRCEEEEEA